MIPKSVRRQRRKLPVSCRVIKPELPAELCADRFIEIIQAEYDVIREEVTTRIWESQYIEPLNRSVVHRLFTNCMLEVVLVRNI